MSSKKKIKLLANAILQDFADSTNDIEICKYTFNLLGNNNCNIKRSLCSLLKDEYFENKTNDKDEIIYPYILYNSPDKEPNTLIHSYTEKDFYFDFHMKRETFCKLLCEIKKDRYFQRIYESEIFPCTLEKSLLMTIWYLAKGGTLYDICGKFNINSTVLKVVEIIINIIVRLQAKYVVWPDKNEAEISSNLFLSNYGYPDAIGALSNIHINFKPPVDKEQLYRNKTLGYSLIVQGISNAKKEFINIFAGFPGSINSASVLKHSVLYKDIEETSPSDFFYNKYHLIADVTYPLRSWLIIPFRNEDSLTSKHMNHNASLKAALTPVDQAFTLLLERWKILNFINANSVNHAQNVIRASCVLHNFCIKNDDIFEKMLKNFENDQRKNMEYIDITRKGVRKRQKNLNKFL